jgi:hypothetical protein
MYTASGSGIVRSRSHAGLPSAASPKLLQGDKAPAGLREQLSPQSLREFARNKARKLLLGDETKSLRDALEAGTHAFLVRYCLLWGGLLRALTLMPRSCCSA